jgi:hypothetical protein
MNQRDQNQGGRRGGRQQGGHSGRDPSARGQGEGRNEGREEEDREHRPRSWSERLSAGFRDVYNPEPQWLREDRDMRRAGSDDEGNEWGRGSYAGTGREWGEPAHPGRGDFGPRYGSSEAAGRESGYDSAYGGSSRDVEQYGGEERGWSERDVRRSQAAGAGRNRPLEGRELEPGQRMQPRGSGYHDLSTGFEPARWDDEDFFSGRRDYGAFRVGTGMGVGTLGDYGGRPSFGGSYGEASGYGGGSRFGSRGGYDLGTHQRDTGRSFRGMGPKDYKRPDERIRDDVYERLTDSHFIDARNIVVEVDQGNVTLNGTVIERRMRYAAEDLVASVMGVANINNQLKVQSDAPAPQPGAAGPTGETPSDPNRH